MIEESPQSCATCKWYMVAAHDGASRCAYFVGLKLPSCFRGLRTRVVLPTDGSACQCWEKSLRHASVPLED